MDECIPFARRGDAEHGESEPSTGRRAWARVVRRVGGEKPWFLVFTAGEDVFGVCVCVLCVFIPSSNGMPVGMGQIQFAGNDASVGVFVCLTFRESVLESQIVRHVE